MRKLWRLVPLGLFVAWLLTGVKEIRPGERAVVRRFGRVLDEQPRAGLWVGFPWGIDRVDRVPIEQVRSVSVGYRPLGPSEDTPPGQLQTGDRNLVNVRVVVNYTVDPGQVVAYVEQEDRVEELISRTAEATLAEWIAGRPVDEVLLKGKTTLPPELLKRLSPRVDSLNLGVRLRGISGVQVEAPEEVKADFDQVAQATARSKKLEEQAEEAATKKANETAAAVYQLETETDTYAKTRPGQARAEAAAFLARLAVYRDNPLVREAGRWSHLQELLRRLGKNNQIMPLDEALTSPLR
jgi:membrane protease subunit HflK